MHDVKRPVPREENVSKTDETLLLAELIAKKHECLCRLDEIGARQMLLIEEGNIAGLLDLLAFKQQFLVRIQQIEQALKPFQRQDPADRLWPDAELRRKTAARLEECKELLARIIERERVGEQILARRRDEIAATLENVRNVQAAQGAYRAQEEEPTIVSRFDASCE